MKNISKAERIFTETYFMCLRHENAWSYDEPMNYNPDGSVIGYNFVACADNETVCTRTLNEMEKHLASGRAKMELAKKYNVIDDEKYKRRAFIYNMVESTIKNTRKAIKEK